MEGRSQAWAARALHVDVWGSGVDELRHRPPNRSTMGRQEQASAACCGGVEAKRQIEDPWYRRLSW